MRAIVALGCLAIVMIGAAPARAGMPSLFRMLEVRVDDSLPLPKWERALALADEQERVFRQCDVDRSACRSVRLAAWRSLLAELGQRPRLEQVTRINAFVNQWHYRTDREAFGESDHWASPLEFVLYGGDCEDFAIMKYVSLRELGIDMESVRLVVLDDVRRGMAHAVLLVALDGRQLVLDNLADDPRDLAAVPHYVPYYSVNESGRWAHLAGGAGDGLPAAR